MALLRITFCALFLPGIAAINVTDNGFQQDIMNMKKDLNSLRSYMSTLNTTIQILKTDNAAKDRIITEMNNTIQDQNKQIKTLNNTIYMIKSEGVLKDKVVSDLNFTIQETVSRQRKLELGELTLYRDALGRLARTVSIFNETGERQNQELKAMYASLKTKLESQQEDIEYLNSTLEIQQLGMVTMNESCMISLQTQQKEITIFNATLWGQHQELMEWIESNSFIDDKQQKEIAFLNETLKANFQESISMNTTILNSLKQDYSVLYGKLEVLEETANRSSAAQEVILKDLVTNLNSLRNSGQIQMGGLNESIMYIAKQMYYTTRSFLDVQKIAMALENSTLDIEENLSKVWIQLTSHGNDIQNIQSDAAKTVAFTVSSSTDLINYYNKKIIYDKIITSFGESYNNHTGIFTCRFPGKYVFSWSTLSGSDKQACRAYIYHNGEKLLESYSYETNGGYNEQASNTIVLSLIVGDQVWIQTTAGACCHGYPFTGFSGWKI